MSPMRGFLRALVAGLAVGAPLVLIAGSLGAEPESLWVLPIALVAGFVGSLFDKEGFWGEPHPFRRRTR